MEADVHDATRTRDDRNPVSCPICGGSAVLYGYQDYPVAAGYCPSRIFRCTPCGFNFRRFDRPLSEVLSHFEVAPYSTADVEERWRRRREGFYYYLLDLLRKPANGRSLLDVGCAFGHFLDCAANRGYRPFGTEVSTEMAELLRTRRDYPVSTRSLEDLQLPEDRFDVVAFVDSFYYFEDPAQTLAHCRKLLRPGGELLMRVTNRNPLARMYRLSHSLRLRTGQTPNLPFWTTDDAISCHSRRSLSELMQRTGFRVRKLTCLERGKTIDSLGLRSYYRLSSLVARLTFERVCVTPGLVCLATPE